MERNAIALVVFAIFAMVVGCTKQVTNPQPSPSSGAATQPYVVTPYGMAQFSYTTFDEAGTPITKGMLILPWPVPADSGFQGTWQAKYSSNDDVAPAPKIGPQTGGGRVVGDMVDGKIRLNLNPNMNDNNVTFVLSPAGERKLSGTWSYSGFAGVMSKGTIEATRE